MDFEDLHGKNGSDTNVGVDLTTLMTSQIAISTSGESVGGGAAGADLTVPRIASFQVYWDVQLKEFKVFNPKVVDPDGNEIDVTETALSRGTYVCEIKKNASKSVYTAAIKLTYAVVPSPETITVVKLFKIEDGKVEQYQVGAIILGGGNVTGEEGQASGSTAVSISGKIDAKGENGSGLVIKTYNNGNRKTVSVDIAGRSSTDVFGIKSVYGSDKKEIAKFISTKDIILQGGSDDKVNVIVGAEFRMDRNNLQVKWLKKEISGVTVKDVETTEWEDIVNGIQSELVIDIDYSETSHKLQKTTMNFLTLPRDGADPAEVTDVFEAKPHTSYS